LPITHCRIAGNSGASYSLLPQDVWQELQLELQETLEFILADGTKIESEASECNILLSGKDRHTRVICAAPQTGILPA